MHPRVTKSVLVLGGTGLLGTSVVEALIKSNRFKVGVFVSDKKSTEKDIKMKKFQEQGCEVHVGDVYCDEFVTKMFRQYDTIVSCVPTSLLTYQMHLLDLAIEAGVSRFFPSDFGMDWFVKGAEYQPYYIPKVAVCRYVQSKQNQISWTSVVTGPFGEFFAYGAKAFGQFIDPVKLEACCLGDPTQQVGFTTIRDTGNFVVECLLHPELTHNRFVRVTSFTASFANIVDVYSQLQGGVKYKISSIPLKFMLEKAKESAKEGNVEMATMFQIMTAAPSGQGFVVDDGLFPYVPRHTIKELVNERLKRDGVSCSL